MAKVVGLIPEAYDHHVVSTVFNLGQAAPGKNEETGKPALTGGIVRRLAGLADILKRGR